MIPNNSSIYLRSGNFLDFKNIRPADFTLSDIAFGLARTFRWNGQTQVPISVLDHSLATAYIMRQLLSLQKWESALLHDAAEAFMGDIAYPLKSLLPDYQYFESRFLDVVDSKYAVETRHPKVKVADRLSLLWEARDMTGYPSKLWEHDFNVTEEEKEFMKSLHTRLFIDSEDRLINEFLGMLYPLT